MVGLLLVSVVASAAGVHLERKRLVALADVLALDAADAVADEDYFAPGAGQGGPATEPATVSTASVRAAVGAYLEDNPEASARWSRFDWSAAATDGGVTAHVEVAAVVRPTLMTWVLAPWSDGITITAESDARTG